ncbi:uncharacterized protein LOC118183164 isoform X2 [Stegodyphus dumicola]|uniref:uncharacterized protein LOC118183164 isoform X2 n=1 Tax=Stegodyphus dumicola TaxID=202533 RepID=UPI0015AECC87|nr:uncharacterized protein LOC118183164 isoform X2 [Stegodyphus dumicola]
MDIINCAVFLLLALGNVSGSPEHEVSKHGQFSSGAAYLLDDLCSQLPDGAYPDYNQACRVFFICSGGRRAATFWCTKGFVFSLAAGHCEPPDKALCPDPKNPSVLDEILHPHGEIVSDQCLQGDGVYPNFVDGCSSFFICRGGVKTTFKCPAASTFDWRTKSCRSSNSLSCDVLSCKDKEDGIYVDSTSYCKRYFECRSGNISEFMCPEGTIYNARHHRCSKSSVTRCHGSESAQCSGIPDGYYPDFAADCKVFGLCMNGGLKTFNCPANTLFDSKTLTCEPDAYCPKPNISKCTGKANGIHPDYNSGCRDFFLCLDGLLTHQGSCPQGKLLNPSNGNCQPSSLVVCSSIVDTDCDGMPDGIYPNYDTGCSAYYICLNQKRVSISYCPGTELYDVATGRCLPSSYVLCRDHSSVASPPRLFDSYNCDNRLGIFPEFSSDCRRYAICAYGQTKYYECSEGLWFDPESNSCQSNKNKCKTPFAVATFQCLPGDDGIYIGSNCSEWHECRNGVGFTNICPPGMQYHIGYSKCIESADICNTNYTVQRRMFRSPAVRVSEVKDSDYNCISVSNGIYPDALSCRKFHFCVDEKSTSFYCPSNFTFDAEEQQCISAHDGNMCEKFRSKRLETINVVFSCEHLDDGMYADFTADCRRYFVCENGNAIPVYCPERQKFNSMKMICDREDAVHCMPSGHISTASPQKKQFRQHDDTYHVYRPEELYTETYSYVPVRNQQVTKPSDFKHRWNDYENPYLEEVPKSTDNQDIIHNSRVPNTIHNESTNKRPYSSKHHSSKAVISTTISYDEAPDQAFTSVDDRSVKLHQVRMQSRDFDAACRKGDTGFFPDYESGCKKFHICFRAIRKTYSCPSVLLFNPETKNCDLPENVVCVRPEPVLETTFDCDGKVNYFMPDYGSGCKSYIGCINNLPYRFICPKGKIFSSVTSICESETPYQCEYPEEYNSTKYGSYDENADKGPSLRHVHGIPGRFYFVCTDKPDGFYPDYTRHCHVFYRCVRGKKFSHYCKQGLLFNPESGICDFEENVACSAVNRTISN